MGATQQFTATGTYSDGTQKDITGSVLWASSDTTIATADAAGLATAIAVGQVTITATDAGTAISATATLNVKNPITAITVTPNPATVTEGGTLQFTATATFFNGTQADVTAQVTWASSSTANATIDNSGLAAGVVAGQILITATDPATLVQGQATVDVVSP